MATETTKKATETEKKTDAAKTEATTKKPATPSKTSAKDTKSVESKTTEKKDGDVKSQKTNTKSASDKKTLEKVEKKAEATKPEEVKTKVELEKSDKSVEVSKPSKEEVSTDEKHEKTRCTETVEERTMFALELKRKVPMYTHMSMNTACRMIKGNVICKSDKPTNGWITIYAGIPEIGKVTGYIRIEQLGWR